jgi:hypothetical protein
MAKTSRPASKIGPNQANGDLKLLDIETVTAFQRKNLDALSHANQLALAAVLDELKDSIAVSGAPLYSALMSSAPEPSRTSERAAD